MSDQQVIDTTLIKTVETVVISKDRVAIEFSFGDKLVIDNDFLNEYITLQFTEGFTIHRIELPVKYIDSEHHEIDCLLKNHDDFHYTIVEPHTMVPHGIPHGIIDFHDIRDVVRLWCTTMIRNGNDINITPFIDGKDITIEFNEHGLGKGRLYGSIAIINAHDMIRELSTTHTYTFETYYETEDGDQCEYIGACTIDCNTYTINIPIVELDTFNNFEVYYAFKYDSKFEQDFADVVLSAARTMLYNALQLND